MTEQTTYTELCSKQPAILDLDRRVRTHRGAKSWNAWEGVKDEIRYLVGWEASSTDPSVCTPQAYEVVYSALWDRWSHTK